MIQHVVERVKQARLGSRIVVATEDDRIKKAVEAFGGEAILTRADHALEPTA
jgi:3-deoxy-manno-octulosonate cytidylyltransferase (CMP-KDO synthetase)